MPDRVRLVMIRNAIFIGFFKIGQNEQARFFIRIRHKQQVGYLLSVYYRNVYVRQHPVFRREFDQKSIFSSFIRKIVTVVTGRIEDDLSRAITSGIYFVVVIDI